MLDQASIVTLELAKTKAKRIDSVALLRLIRLATRSDSIEKLGVKTETASSGRAEKVFYFVEGDATCPGKEIAISIKCFKFLPKQNTATLKHIFRIVTVRKQRMDVAKQSIAFDREVS